MATDPEWRSTAMVLPDWDHCGGQLELRDANGTVSCGEFWFDTYLHIEESEEEHVPMVKMQDGADRSLHEFDSWRPYEEDRT